MLFIRLEYVKVNIYILTFIFASLEDRFGSYHVRGTFLHIIISVSI